MEAHTTVAQEGTYSIEKTSLRIAVGKKVASVVYQLLQ